MLCLSVGQASSLPEKWQAGSLPCGYPGRMVPAYMSALTSVVPQLRHVLTHGRWFTPSIVVLFVGLEMFGRRALSDVHDTVGAVVLLLILAGIAVRHRVNPISWVKRLGGALWWVAKFADRLKVDIGPDLRGTP